MNYSNLNQAAEARKHLAAILAKGTTKVYYAKSLRDVGMGYEFCKKHCPFALGDMSNYVLLGEVAERNLETIYMALQGGNWSPNGEARDLIKSLGLTHTSMSMGDMIEIDGKFFVVDSFGFTNIETGEAA